MSSSNAPAVLAQDSNAVVVSRPSIAPTQVVEEPASAHSKSHGAQHVGAAIMEANKTMKAIDANLQFAVDPETNMTVIKVVDISSNTVLRQIPAQEMIDIAQALGKMKGVLLKQEA
jgi:flagellar protein FlaG